MSEIKIDPSNVLGRKSLVNSITSCKDGNNRTSNPARAEIDFNLHDDEAEFATKNSVESSKLLENNKESKTFYQNCFSISSQDPPEKRASVTADRFS